MEMNSSGPTVQIGYYPSNHCTPFNLNPRDADCTELIKFLFFAEALWPKSRFVHKYIPYNYSAHLDVVGSGGWAISNGLIETVFHPWLLKADRIKYLNYLHPSEYWKVSFYYNIKHPEKRNSAMEEIRRLLIQVLNNMRPLDWQVWLTYAVISVFLNSVTFLSNGRFKKVGFVLCLGIMASMLVKAYKTNLSAVIIAPQHAKPPFRTLDELAELIHGKSLRLVAEFVDAPLMHYLRNSSNPKTKAIANALKVNPPLGLIEPADIDCRQIGRYPDMVLLSFETDKCDLSCLQMSLELEDVYTDRASSYILHQNASIAAINRGNVFAEASKQFNKIYDNRNFQPPKPLCETIKTQKMVGNVSLLFLGSSLVMLSFGLLGSLLVCLLEVYVINFPQLNLTNHVSL